MAETDFRSRLVGEYPWIALDILFAALLAAVFLGYPQYSPPTQTLLRGLLVAGLWLFLISSWHLQVVRRYYETKRIDPNIPAWQSFSFALLRLAVISLFTCWAIRTGLLDMLPAA